ncbi:hypothetical protein CVT24_000589 [Panaeolus cyanescens]|uniref:Glycosyl transferase CAP10 domain-containing protein n=1 Tax=Panaeolus cyanescens TaxID=181874 RepID=A0A409YDE7_9AGAR|nr:hypothetical protein CVT24_000589 [Panaeolus cyanescens]
MFWSASDILYSRSHHIGNASHASPRARLSRAKARIRFTRRASILLIISLMSIILYLARTLGRIARDPDSLTIRAYVNIDSRQRGRMPEAAGSERAMEWLRWKEIHESEVRLTKEGRQAEEIRAWVLSRRSVQGAEGSNEIAGRDTDDELKNEIGGNQLTTSSEVAAQAQENLLPQASSVEAMPLGDHIYRPDGLLEVNPAGPHPIYELIERSEKEWIQKHRRASKTLKEAAEEYKRRYGRLPPAGYNIWLVFNPLNKWDFTHTFIRLPFDLGTLHRWDYVQRNHVPLPDEYDQINNDLAPFWAVDPVDLQATLAKQELHTDSFTIGKDSWSSRLNLLNFSFNGENGHMSNHPGFLSTGKDGSRPIIRRGNLPESLSKSTQGPRYKQFLDGAFGLFDLLDEVEDYLPPFRAVFSPHDNPSLLRDWETMSEAADSIKRGKTLNIAAIENEPRQYQGWRTACPPDSPARRQVNTVDWDNPDAAPTFPPLKSIQESNNETFIHSQGLTMDPCLHPSHFILHGQFLSHRNGPNSVRDGGGFIPMFSHSPTMLHTDITVAVGEGSHHSSPNPDDDDDFAEFGAMDVTREDGLQMDFDINALLELPEHEIERALDLDTDPRLLWRGSNTGIWHAPRWNWERSQRARLVFWAGGGEGIVVHGNDSNAEREMEHDFGRHLDLKTARAFGAGLGGKLNVLMPPPNRYASPIFYNGTRRPVGPLTQVRKSHYASSMLDVAFAGVGSEDGGFGPNSCEASTCEKLRKIFEWRKRMEMKEASQYRFVMDVDGHAWSSRFRTLLVGTSSSSQSLGRSPRTQPGNLRSSVPPKERRWNEHLQRRGKNDPPASLVGLEDLWDALVFFRGKLGDEADNMVMELRQKYNTLSVETSEDSKATIANLERKTRDALERHLLGRKIARRGRKWAERYWRKEDMVAYMFRLFLEYGRVMSLNRNEMFFDPDNPQAGFKPPMPVKQPVLQQQSEIHDDSEEARFGPETELIVEDEDTLDETDWYYDDDDWVDEE